MKPIQKESTNTIQPHRLHSSYMTPQQIRNLFELPSQNRQPKYHISCFTPQQMQFPLITQNHQPKYYMSSSNRRCCKNKSKSTFYYKYYTKVIRTHSNGERTIKYY